MKLPPKIMIMILCAFILTPGYSRSDEDYPDREILRPMVIPRGYVEFATGFSWVSTERAFDDGGNLEDLGDDFTEMIWNMRLGVGVVEGLELRVGIPYVMRELDVSGSPSVEGFGDLEATILLHAYRQTADRPTSIVVGVKGIFPIGESEIGDYWELLMRPPSRGTYAVGPMIWLREAYTSYLGFQSTFEWDFYFEGEQDFEGVTADSDYGDIMRVSIEPIIQISDHLAIWISTVYTKKFKSTLTYQGVRVAEYDRSELLEVRPALEAQFGRHMDLFIGTSWRAWGRYEFGGWPVWAELEVRF